MTYIEFKNEFLRKHSDSEYSKHTSPMDEHGAYVSTYIFTDGAVLSETNRTLEELAEAEVEVKGVKVQLSQMVRLMETLVWDTDSKEFRTFYERW